MPLSTFSLAQADQENIVITVAKEACDSEAIILRAYEAHGKRTKVTFTMGLEAKSVSEVDMLESTEYEKIDTDGCGFTTQFRPYEIKTFRVNY